MKRLMDLFLSFTQKNHSTSYKIVSFFPGTVVFLIITPLFLFFFSRYLSQFVPITWPKAVETTFAGMALFLAILFMMWGTLSLWIHGKGTPAPIAPTRNVVTTGAYGFCRNPIELGTNLYFFTLGTWLDSLNTGILCMIFGMLLGYGYIKIIEERELSLRFGKEYKEYLTSSPLFLPDFFKWRQKRHD